MTNAEWKKSLNNSKQQTKVPEGALEIFLSCAVSPPPPSPSLAHPGSPPISFHQECKNGAHCILLTADDGATSTRLKLHCYT